MSLRIVLGLVAAASLAACVQRPMDGPKTMSGAQAPRALNEHELRALFNGRTINDVVPEGLQDLSTPEQFNKDGTYVRYADNRELEGRFTIESGMVCVDYNIHPKFCRYIFIDDAGFYYKSPSMESPRYPISVSPRPK
ncbi:MAG: hypothetical protein M3Q52_06675 [Pseudomonadota bacterium]|nr:hypothetical protein [Pseudomonadota bacterium]